MKMKELPSLERPYEKLELYGEDKLTDTELLSIIIKTGTKKETALQIAQKVLSLGRKEGYENLEFLQQITIEQFTEIKGIGKIKAIQLKAVAELAKRISKPINNKRINLKSTDDVAKLLMQEMKNEKRELAKLLILNNKNIVLKIKDISFGGTNFAMISPKEILVDAIKMQADRIILVHNHPSGDPTPSKQDYILTQKIMEAAELFNINLIDHIVIGDNKYKSVFSEK